MNDIKKALFLLVLAISVLAFPAAQSKMAYRRLHSVPRQRKWHSLP